MIRWQKIQAVLKMEILHLGLQLTGASNKPHVLLNSRENLKKSQHILLAF
jgi:hypothetical protein